MRTARRSLTLFAAATAAAAALLAAPGFAQASTPAGTAVPAVSMSDLARAITICPSGNVCFFTGANFSGQMCKWSNADPDWQSGAIICSWAAKSDVKSVYNAGTSTDLTGVVYYSKANYTTRKGCTKQQQGGNLAGTYKLDSHEWTDGNCG